MKHLIVIFHFICFAVGIGCVTYVYTLFRKRKLYRYLAISEGLLSLWFLFDCIKSYMRNLVSTDAPIDVMGMISIILSVAGLLFFIPAIHTIKKANVQYRITTLYKVFMSVTALCLLGWAGSGLIKWLQEIPSLCLAFISQCICVFLITSNEVIEPEECEKQISELTDREIEIVEYLVRGSSYKEIGEALFISPNTVRNHTANIYRKLDVKNRIQLVNQIKTTK